MNKHLIAVASALLITGTAPAFAASTVDLTVKGIITPPLDRLGVQAFGVMTTARCRPRTFTQTGSIRCQRSPCK